MIVLGNNRNCTKAPVDEVVNESDGILIEETTEFIDVSTLEELKVNHIIYILVEILYISFYLRGIYSSGLNNKFMVSVELHEVW